MPANAKADNVSLRKPVYIIMNVWLIKVSDVLYIMGLLFHVLRLISNLHTLTISPRSFYT